MTCVKFLETASPEGASVSAEWVLCLVADDRTSLDLLHLIAGIRENTEGKSNKSLIVIHKYYCGSDYSGKS